MRHFGDERFGEAVEPGSAGGGFPPGQGNLGGDAASLLLGRDAQVFLGAALDGVERDSDPRLRGSGRGLQVLKPTQLVDQQGTVPQFAVGQCPAVD
ncbi:hypothetical protein GCM10027038_09440 [Arthrobacter bambusae]